MNRCSLFIFIVSFLICLSLRVQAAEPNCETATQFDGSVCWLALPSANMNGDTVAVKVFVPRQFTNQVFLFLHGKGYTRGLQSPEPTMLEHMGGLDWILQRQQQGLKAPIIVAPQDNFVHVIDGENRAGRDYWIGTGGRNWGAFFRNDLVPYVNSAWGSARKPLIWKTSGISMGAHGALRLGWLDPQLYTAIASISPILRSTESQMQAVASFQDRQENSIGFELVHAQADNDCSLVPETSHFIRIHANDFGYRSFTENPVLFDFLEQCSRSPDAQIAIDQFPIESSDGHSAEYWRQVLPETFDWLLDQTLDHEIRI